jgi:alpha-1,3-rhamnosyl/mannosyltransferase
MAVGTAVITSGGTAVPEIVGDAGLYVSNKLQDVVDGILQIAGDAAYIESLRIAGRRRAKHFTWEACVERLMTALKVHS